MCQAYHWSFDEALKLTLPQIVMLNHASWVNNERMKTRTKSDDAKDVSELKDPVVMNGKRMSQLSEKEQISYFGNWS